MNKKRIFKTWLSGLLLKLGQKRRTTNSSSSQKKSYFKRCRRRKTILEEKKRREEKRSVDLEKKESITSEKKESIDLEKKESIDLEKKESITSEKKEKILSILNVFETGSVDGDYTKISIFNDGPNNIKQVTYGRSQTTEFGSLKVLVKMYVESNGKYSTELSHYVDRVGRTPSLCNEKGFLNILQKAGSDPIMVKVQDNFFDSYYWDPAYKFFVDNGFKTPLAMLVIYDSYMHSGSIPSWLRRRFSAVPPSKGGTEAGWITAYIETRHDWLSTHSRKILRKTIYRTSAFLSSIRANDWSLDEPFNANGTFVD